MKDKLNDRIPEHIAHQHQTDMFVKNHFEQIQKQIFEEGEKLYLGKKVRFFSLEIHKIKKK